MADAPMTLRRQADAVEHNLTNHKGHVAKLLELRSVDGKWNVRKVSDGELELAQMVVPGLEAALKTLRLMEKHEQAYRELTEKLLGKRA